MFTLRNAVSDLLKAQTRYFDAFEAAVIESLPDSDRLALQGSDNSDEGRDRTSLLLLLYSHSEKVRDSLLTAEAEEEAYLIAEAGVKSAASLISVSASHEAKNCPSSSWHGSKPFRAGY